MRPLITIFFLVLFSFSIQANSISECGKYELFGKVVGKSGLILKINLNSKSEYTLKINPDDYPEIGTYLNHFIRADWEIIKLDNFLGEITKPKNIKIELENSLNPQKENFKLLEKKECLKN